MPERLKCLALGFVAFGSVLSMSRHVELSADPFKMDRSKLRADIGKVAEDMVQGVKKVQDEQSRKSPDLFSSGRKRLRNCR